MATEVGVLGGGAFGTALAVTASRAGRNVTLYARNPDVRLAIERDGENRHYLSGIALPEFAVTGDFRLVCKSDILLLAIPAQQMRTVLRKASAHIKPSSCLVSCAKGLEQGSGYRMSEVIKEEVQDVQLAVLSGPGFASDMANGFPTAVVIAAQDRSLAQNLCQTFSTPTFRPYAGTDLIGVEIGGSVKNVLAIAAGIVDGRALGASALAALIARSFAELRRLGRALGGNPETLMGLSGLGDLVLTCSNTQSRNFSFGRMLGTGGNLDQPHPLVEGIATAGVTQRLAQENQVPMPIVDAVVDVLTRRLDIGTAIERLMSRPLTFEVD